MATTIAKPNRTYTKGTDQQVIVGIKQDLQSMSSLPLGGSTYTPTSLAAAIQSRIDAANAVATAKANWQSAAKTYTAIDGQVTVLVRELKNLVIGAFGPTSPKLADFGFAATKRTTLTVEQKAQRAEKAKATRLARGTKGKKQKAAIKGVVPTTAPTTAAAPATVSVATQTAPAMAPQGAAPVAPVTPLAPAAAPAVAAGGSAPLGAGATVASAAPATAVTAAAPKA